MAYEQIIESLLFVVGDDGIDPRGLSQALEISEAAAREQLLALQTTFEAERRVLQIVESGGVFKMVTRKEMSPYIQAYAGSLAEDSLSRAAMETLVIIAYKQPVTRADIEVVRGVKTERVIHTLSAKGLIEEAGRAKGVGRAKLYKTTDHFLDHFGLNSIEELPPLEFEETFESDGDLFFRNDPSLEERVN
ncbi:MULTISPECIES: SMC-Scp complex subunit ScpB [unclassified Exiguobacterium]|uniref:SMC-Scp complex subunit ScpB n=1 Tax=unclassified Exiguobacterium TaxID=2644629 RepID=UPI000EDB0BAD|nr:MULTISPECIES: SMC-Scp complex subunit ScpB [unclassified Exiguobacterium]HAL00593.1 SMC-Scp complex subunit ScpB [Exiguobacterium sp.]